MSSDVGLLDSHILDFPTEIWLNILGKLPNTELHIVPLVCKRLYHLVTKFYTHRMLRVDQNNLVDIAARIKAALDNANANDELEEISTELHFECVEMVDMKNTEEWCFVLEHLGRDIKVLKLTNCVLFERLSALVPNVEKLIITHMCEMSDDEPLKLCNFRKLNSLNTASRDLLKTTRHALIAQLSQAECQQRMRRLDLIHSPCTEMHILRILSRNAKNLNKLAVHFETEPRLSIELWCGTFRCLSRLRAVKFTGCYRNEVFTAVFSAIPVAAPLQAIDLSGNLFITDAMLTTIINKWAHCLQKLDIMYCAHITDTSLKTLKMVRNTLRVLNIGCCNRITSKGLLEGIAAECNTVLTTLNLYDFNGCDKTTLSALVKRLPNLQKLNLSNCRNGVDNNVVATIVQHMVDLRVLVLDDCKSISDAAFVGFGEVPYPINRLRKLEALSCRGCHKLTNLTLSNLQLRNLLTFRIGYWHHIDSKGIAALVQGCPGIQELIVTSCPLVDGQACRHIADGLKHLRALNLSNCWKLSNPDINYIIEHCPTLKVMCVFGIHTVVQREIQGVCLSSTYFDWDSTAFE